MIAPAGVWTVDAGRSRVEFAIKHMLVSTLKGSFRSFEGTLEIDRDGSARARGSVEAASIDTGDAVRDEHVRDSKDFFDVAKHPRIELSGATVEERGGRRLRIRGELSMRGVSRPIVLDGRSAEPVDGVVRLELSGELNRRDYGLVWNQKLDSGGALIGNTVRVTAEIVAVEGAASARRARHAAPARGNARAHRRAATGS